MAAGGKLQMGQAGPSHGHWVSLWKWCPSGRTQGMWLLPLIKCFKLASQTLELIPVKTRVTEICWLTGNSLGIESLKVFEVFFGLDCWHLPASLRLSRHFQQTRASRSPLCQLKHSRMPWVTPKLFPGLWHMCFYFWQGRGGRRKEE